jgi:hypothetical protein
MPLHCFLFHTRISGRQERPSPPLPPFVGRGHQPRFVTSGTGMPFSWLAVLLWVEYLSKAGKGVNLLAFIIG